MAFTATATNAARDGVTALGKLVSLHSADPGTTGASEITGSGYARQALSAWSAGSATASFAFTGAISFSHFGVWETNGTTFLYGDPISAAETYSANGGSYNFTANLSAS